MSFFKKLFSFGPSDEVIKALENGAVILDVRTTGEYNGGNYKGSKNIPLDRITNHFSEIKGWKKQVVVVCASGMRSANATGQLKKQGIDAINGGGWSSLPKKG